MEGRGGAGEYQAGLICIVVRAYAHTQSARVELARALLRRNAHATRAPARFAVSIYSDHFKPGALIGWRRHCTAAVRFGCSESEFKRIYLNRCKDYSHTQHMDPKQYRYLVMIIISRTVEREISSDVLSSFPASAILQVSNTLALMPSKSQLTGMRGVYLVAAELSRLGFLASPTSRSAVGADLLVTDQACKRTYSVQVKSNARTFSFWLVGEKALHTVAPTHLYALVNLRSTKTGRVEEYYLVPSETVAQLTKKYDRANSTFFALHRSTIEKYRNAWSLFGDAL